MKVRVGRVLTNETCNQNCRHCHTRRERENRGFVATGAVRGRVAQAAERGAHTLILTGGEPTMRRDLAALVADAKRRGIERVVLETNAALVDTPQATALKRAGLDEARINLPGWGDQLERINRDPGSFEAMMRGAGALVEAGIELRASVPIVRENLEHVARLPARLRASGLPFAGIVTCVPNVAPEPDTLVTPSEAARALQELEAAARREDLELRLDRDALVPPCFFERPARVAHLYEVTRGGGQREDHRHVEACDKCRIRERCPGIPLSTLERSPGLEVHPIEQDRVRRRLSIISSIEDQVRRELYQDDLYMRDRGEPLPARIVRVNFRCNQSCHFCFVSTHLPTAEDEAVRSAIDSIAGQGGVLVLSGGEPTLNPKLLDYVRLGRERGASTIELQSNAIRLGEGSLAADLADAGVDVAFISLHGSRAEISDRVTDAPGTFAKTVVGIDAWMATGKQTRINFVFCQHNLHDFPDYVRLVASRWPEAVVVVSFVAPSTDVVPRTSELIPRYGDVMPFLGQGLRVAEELGVEVSGFDSMCGIPLCLVPASIERYFGLTPVPEGFDGGEFVKAEACRGCSLEGRCFGVRRGYAEMYGTSEFRPVERPLEK